MLNFREHWRELKRGRRGHRFRDGFDRRLRRNGECHAGEGVVLIVLATIAFLVGLVLTVLPGPAFPFFVIAGGLLALLSRSMARLMDWLEIRTYSIWRWMRQHWRKLPGGVRVFLLMLGAGVSATATYLSVQFFRD